MRYHTFLFVVACFFLVCAMPSKDTVAAQSSATQVHGVVEEVKGDVTYEYGARFRVAPLMLNQTWQRGDVIRTGKDSSVTLKMEATGDVITIGEESEIYFSVKKENLYFHILKGRAFILAEKRESEVDAMYVLSGDEAYKVVGTQFFTIVDPHTGQSELSVFAGIVNRQSQRGNNVDDQPILPGQTSYSTIQDTLPVLSEDLEPLLNEAIIRTMLENFLTAQDENDDLLKRLREDSFVESPSAPDDLIEMERLLNNLEKTLANIVSSAINSNKVSEEEIRSLINEVNQDLSRPLDIDSAEPYDPRLTDREKAIREQLERQQEQQRQRQQAEQERQEERQKQNKELLDRLVAEQQRQKDEQARLRQEKQDELRKQLEDSRTPAPSPTPSRPSRPNPEIEPEKLEVALDRDLFSINAEWTFDERYHSYKFYLDNLIVETDEEDINPFEFKNLRPDRDYTIKIEALDEAGKVLARFEERSVSEIDESNIVNFKPYIYGNSLYVWFEDADDGEPMIYTVWIDGEEVGYLEGAGNYYVCGNCDHLSFETMKDEFDIHLFASEDSEPETERVYIGSATVSAVGTDGVLEMIDLTEDTAYVEWFPPLDDENNPLNSYLSLYELTNDENWEEHSDMIDYNGPVIFSDLEPSTHYKISEFVDGEEEPLREIKFTTKEK